MTLPLTEEQLWSAWERVQENRGCAGVDGVSVDQFARKAHHAVPALLERLQNGFYRAFPLLKIVVEKRHGSTKTRKLLVPTVADRILQTATARHLSRSFEEEFLECSYGYRPGRSVDRAIARLRKCHEMGYRFAVDADIESYFDRVSHELLLQQLRSRDIEPEILELLTGWVEAEVWDGQRLTRLTAGVPQGSPISPLLANFFLEEFDLELEKSGRKLIRYADDLVVLSKTRDEAEQAMLVTESALAALHLKLNREKTAITSFEDGFRFLGALFLGEAIWIPWKHESQKGRVLFMAPALPLGLRTRYEFAAPRRGMELAFQHAGIPRYRQYKPTKESERSRNVAYLYLTEQGSVLRKAGDRFLVEKDEEVLLDLPYHKLEAVLLFGNIQVTTQALGELLEKGVKLSLFSRQGGYRGCLTPPQGKNVPLRLAQFERYGDPKIALGTAVALVGAKIRNGLALLTHYREKHQVSPEFDDARQTIATAFEACHAADSIASLDGYEGAAASAYFRCLMEFNTSGMKWPGRKRHPATDPLNALLSLTYTLLMHELTGLLDSIGLDPYLGFLHQMDYGRPSLALDLLEPFRHPVADRLVLMLVNRQMIDAADFRPSGEAGGLFLAPAPFKRFLGEYERWVLARPSGAAALGGVAGGFRSALRDEVERFAAAVRDGAEFTPYQWPPPAAGGGTSNTLSVTT